MRRHNTLATATSLVLLHALLPASPAQAVQDLVFSHAGCVDPGTPGPDATVETWTLDDLVAPGAVAPECDDAGVDAWEISDPDATLSGPRYRHDPSGAAGAANGWSLRARVRVRDLSDAVDGSSVLEASVGGLRYRVALGNDAMGNTLVRPEGAASDLIAQAAGFEQSDYHDYELSWSPVDGQADLFVDGALLAPDLPGIATLDSRIVFGADDAAGTGTARYSDLAFETGVQECRNGIDDDGDGRIDQVPGDSDSGCESPTDTSEHSPLRMCDDGLDNDGDGFTDKFDPDCSSITGRSEFPGVQIISSGEGDWAAAAGGATPLVFDTTAANVALANEVASPPGVGAYLCGPPGNPQPSCQLSFEAVNTQLCRDFTLRSLQAGSGITFDDSQERSDSPAWQEALSIGDINDHPNDDFAFSFGTGEPVHAFGFHFVDNQRQRDESLKVYGPGDQLIAILPGHLAPVSDGNRVAFVGIVSPLPITRVFFDEDTSGDDLAIRDFRFGDPDPDADGLGDCAEAGLGTDPNLADSDGDGLADGDELAIHSTDPLDPDSDDDGLSDGDEVGVHATNPLDADSDDDGLSDGAEIATHSTDPLDSDSDDDGLSDGDEVGIHLTAPLDPDSDDDGLPDGVEVGLHGTNPLDPDTDADGLADGAELSIHGSSPTNPDSDADGLSDGDEVSVHATSPTNADSDGDGLPDGDEVSIHGTSPTSADTDADGLSDADEVNVHGTSPTNADSDGDGVPDPDELAVHGTDPNSEDSDADGLSDGDELNVHGTSPTNADSDGDGLADGPEVGAHGTDPLSADTDSDGLSDGVEVMVHQTDPLLADSDGDFYSDGAEIAAGTDPLDPASFPVAAVPAMGETGRILAAGLLLLLGLGIARRRMLGAR
jgi:hypothetical protein